MPELGYTKVFRLWKSVGTNAKANECENATIESSTQIAQDHEANWKTVSSTEKKLECNKKERSHAIIIFAVNFKQETYLCRCNSRC